MNYTINTRYEKKRGCGYRKGGGLYMVSGKGSMPCGKLPIEATVCPCCGEGIQQARGYRTVSAELVRSASCTPSCNQLTQFKGCFPFGSPLIKKYGLMWVGKKFYKSPEFFMQEAAEQGISKRMPFIPTDFTVGVDWILLAHPETPFYEAGLFTGFKPGIFTAFCPEAIEYVVKGTESPDELQAMANKNITLVNVRKWEENPDLVKDEQLAVDLQLSIS